MKDLFDIFDSLLTIMVSYPVTLFHLFFSPEKVVGLVKNSLICLPGTCFIISLTIWYFSESTRRSILSPSIDWPSSPAKTLVIRLIILTNFILILQYLVILIPRLLPIPPSNPIAIIGLLSYPVSVSLVANGVAYLFCILFPSKGKISIMERIDPIWRAIPKSEPRNITIENADDIGLLAAILAYLFCTYNVTRVGFGISLGRAIFLTTLLSIVAISLLVGFLKVFERYDRIVKDLVSQKASILGPKVDVDKRVNDKSQESKGG